MSLDLSCVVVRALYFSEPPDDADTDAVSAFRSRALTDAPLEAPRSTFRTHLVNEMYAVADMGGDNTTSVLPTQNMMRRNLQITHEFDSDDNSVVVINAKSQIYFAHQDDSVENGIMQPVSAVIENSTLSVPSLVARNPRVSLYSQALEATKLSEIGRAHV